MFKYVLCRALETTANVFSDLNPPTPADCQKIMDEYNRRAKPVWECEERDFADRRWDCEVIREKLLPRFYASPRYQDFQPVPKPVLRELDLIFRQHYSSCKTYLLFGRTDEKALDVQDKYGLSVARALRGFNSRCEAQAHLYLRKMYGRGAPLPLLGTASASAMWEACSSYYYQSQIVMVSSTITAFQNLTNL